MEVAFAMKMAVVPAKMAVGSGAFPKGGADGDRRSSGVGRGGGERSAVLSTGGPSPTKDEGVSDHYVAHHRLGFRLDAIRAVLPRSAPRRLGD